MRSIRKLTLAAVLALAMVAALALPASAAGSGHVAVFRGTATLTVPLHFPGLPAVTTAGQAGEWSFEATSTNVLCQGVTDGPCQIEASGKLGSVLTQGTGSDATGAWCGMSSGTDGTGSYRKDDAAPFTGTLIHNLSDVGWVASAGSVLPVTGSADGHTLVAFVQASGSSLATDCATGGATTFDVNGVAVIV